MPEWVEEFDRGGIATEDHEAFGKFASKYETANAAVVGGFNASKLAGRPFKLPESMDKLPDDASRTDLATQAHKLMGTSPAIKSIDDLVDMNFKEGLADDAVVDENLTGVIKKWAVEAGISKTALTKMIGFYNGGLADFSAQASEARSKQAAADKLAAITSTNEAMAEHFGGADKVDQATVLMHRALVNNVGCTAEEADAVSQLLKDGEGATNPALRKVLLSVLPVLAAENKNRGPGKGNEPAAKKSSYAETPTGRALGWK